MTPFIACLCPTYCRPKLLEKSIQMFLEQDYPEDRRHLCIYDDAPGAIHINGNGWTQFFRIERCPSLPQKFNELVNQFAMDLKPDVFCVWEDDDEYRPWHLSAHAAALERGEFSKPSVVLSDYPGKIVEEPGAGRFHASMAFTRELYQRVGGWPLTKRADFDQQMIALLAREARGVVDPCKIFPPSYVFKWHTGHYHGQHEMRSPDDETWYERCAR